MKPSYSEQLRDPRWQKKRLEILQRDEFHCRMCESSEKELHIHHRRYFRNKPLWDVGDDNLVTLCSDCHASVTELKNNIAACLDFDPHYCFFESCYNSLSEFNWVELQEVFKVLITHPKEVKRLYKKLLKK